MSKKSKTASLGRRLATGFGLCAGITALFSVYAIWQVNRLGAIQDMGAERARDAEVATAAAAIAEQDYSIVADLIINRNLSEGKKDWAEAKESDLKQFEAVEKMADTEGERARSKEALSAWREIVQIVEQELIPLLERDKEVGLDRMSAIDGRIDEKKRLISGSLQGIAESMRKEALEADQEFDSGRKRVVWMSLIFALCSVGAAMGLAAVMIRSVTSRVRSVAEALSEGAGSVSDTSHSMAETSAELSSSATEQASAIQETVSSVDEVNAMVAKNAENAKKSNEVARASSKAATRGREAIGEMMDAIGEIDRSNDEVTQQIMEGNRKIGEITQLIGEIGNKTKVINDIVFQTKLLSFNASVEAARAGEHGKGFAVVAEEVGNLAQMSGNAAKEISALLEGSVRRVEAIVGATTSQVDQLAQVGKTKISAGTQTAKKCGDILAEIVTSVSEVSQLVEEIAQASQEQAQGVNEISKAMGQLDQVTQQNTKAADNAALAGEKLSTQAGKLMEVVRDLREIVDGASPD